MGEKPSLRASVWVLYNICWSVLFCMNRARCRLTDRQTDDRRGRGSHCNVYREIGKCQNWKVSESIFCPFWAKLESVRIGKCQNWKVSELESVRNCSVLKVSELESVRNGWDWKVSEMVEIGKCQKWLRLESVRIGKCQNWKVSEIALIGNSWDWKVTEL